MLIKFIHPYEHYKIGTVVDVEIDRARRLLELDFVQFIPTLQSLSDVKQYSDYENKLLTDSYDNKTKKPQGRPPGRPRKKKRL